MIARMHRFHGYGSLKYVYRNATTARGSLCSLKYARNDRRRTYRVAVVVSKKVHKSAVVRNRIRRRIYEVVRTSVVANEPNDLVYIVYNDRLATCPPDELRRAVVGLLRAARIPIKEKIT